MTTPDEDPDLARDMHNDALAADAHRQSLCDHDWRFRNDSFDHEYGCERVHFYECQRCGATKDAPPNDNDYPDGP